MSSNISFASVTRERVHLIQEGLMHVALATADASPILREQLLQPYRELLDELYEDELPVAKLADEADLLLHVSGAAASGRAPRVTLLTKFMTQARDEVTRLAKQIVGLDAARVPASLDMSLVGMARGSLFLGFSALDDTEAGNATRRAVETIGEASLLISRDASLAELAGAIDDPATRDTAIAAVRHLAPSGNIGVTQVEILGRRVAKAVTLTTETRRNARRILSQSFQPAACIELIGTVRELDLDASRFELRNIEGNALDVRCAHELPEDEVQPLMNRRVRVAGRPEYAKGAVRLLWVDQVELLDDAR